MENREIAVTDKVASKLLGINRGTLINWRSQRKGPRFIKMGKIVRYRMSDLEDFLDVHTRTTDGV